MSLRQRAYRFADGASALADAGGRPIITAKLTVEAGTAEGS
jgi:hypothetical protein